MSEETKPVSDFRYDSGEARIPWAAVGEPARRQEIQSILQFLVRPAAGNEQAYEEQLARVMDQVDALIGVGELQGKLTLGNHVQALEAEAARFLRAKHTLFLTNATAGFEIGYKYAGLKAGDEVIAPAVTFIATIAYPLAIGARVVLADVDPRTLNMDPEDVQRKITPRTRVIIPVHLGGYPVDMDPIMDLAAEHDLTVIEDAAHAFGASYRGRMAGTIGHFGSFSFHEVKNITALGEGGLLCTDLDFGAHLGKARFLGLDLSRQIPNWLYDVVALQGKEGYFVAGNHSATEVQAVCLLSQMKRIDQVIARRRQAAEFLNSRLQDVDGVITPLLGDGQIVPTHHLYLLQVDPARAGGDIQQLKAKLQQRGVVQIPHFAPLYKFTIMRQLGYDTEAIQASCPVAEEAFSHRFTHLPLYDFTQEQLEYLAGAVIESVREMQAGR